MDIADTLNQTPNFTVLAPGPCNAKCDFCFWNHDYGNIKAPWNYLRILRDTLNHLPAQYKLVSVSGGEPTLSPQLMPLLRMVANVRQERRFDRVILTTNGTRLKELADGSRLLGLVTAVNISRHSYDDAANSSIFKSKKIPDTQAVKTIITALADQGIPVTLNCVIDDNCTKDFVLRMIDYSARVGAEALSLRKQASTIDPTPVEKEFSEIFGAGTKNNCPVCRGHNQKIFGRPVLWKGSVAEPSVTCGKTYEAVFFPNGNTYADWAMNIPLQMPAEEPQGLQKLVGGRKPDPELKPKRLPVVANRDNYGCGGPSNSGCGPGSNGCG